MIANIEITKREPLAAGAVFGASGTYERIDGIASGTLDPAHPANQGIALLDQAAMDFQSIGQFSSDAGPCSVRASTLTVVAGAALAQGHRSRQWLRDGRPDITVGADRPCSRHAR